MIESLSKSHSLQLLRRDLPVVRLWQSQTLPKQRTVQYLPSKCRNAGGVLAERCAFAKPALQEDNENLSSFLVLYRVIGLPDIQLLQFRIGSLSLIERPSDGKSQQLTSEMNIKFS